MTPADDVESAGGGIRFSTWGGTLTSIDATTYGAQGAWSLSNPGGGYVYVQVTVPAGTSVSYTWDNGQANAYNAADGIRIDPSRAYNVLMIQLSTPDDDVIMIERYAIKLT